MGYCSINFDKFLVPKIQYLLFFSNFQLNKIRLKKTALTIFFIFTYVNPLEPIETFKPHFKKSDGLKWRQFAFKVENLKKLSSIKILSFRIYLLNYKTFFSISLLEMMCHENAIFLVYS